MRVILLLGIVSMISTLSNAQNIYEISDSTYWQSAFEVNLRGSETTYTNWSLGGVNAITTIGTIHTDHIYYSEKFNYRIRADIRLGQNRLQGEDFRKSDDLFQIQNKFKYFLNGNKFAAFAEVDFRTQFLKGFESDNETVISAFMAPGFLLESVGLAIDPNEHLDAQAGLALRQTFVRIDSLDQLYGFKEDQDVRAEGGFTIKVEYEKEIFKNFTYRSDFTSFSNLLIPLRSTDIIFNNEFRGEINEFMEAVIGYDLIYDDDFSNRLQTRRLIAIGLTFKIL